MAAARLHGPSIRRRFASRAGVLLAMAAAHPFSLLVTLVLLYAAWIVGERIVSWGIIHATFIADDRRGCNPGGACWAFVVNRLPQFLFGFSPEAERWRALAAVLAPPALMRPASSDQRRRVNECVSRA